MFKKSIAFVLLLGATAASAHCPAHFKEEKVCFMLDQNVIYVYDEKKPHSGPYQDFKASSLESIKSEGAVYKFQKAARGVYKIEGTKILKNVELELMSDKKKVNLKLKTE